MRIPLEGRTSYRGRNSRPNWLILAAFIAPALGAWALGAIFSPGTSAAASHWYAALTKPVWAPPNAWFGPVGLVLYVLMGTSAWFIWGERYHRGRTEALAAYAVQFLLNAAWAPLFFGARSIGGGLFLSIALWVPLGWTIREFAVVKSSAAWMLAPYMLWVSFAAALNLALWKLNQ